MAPRVRNLSKDTIEELLINTENNFDKFQTSINSEKILKLNKEFKKNEKKGFINYSTFIHSMKSVFDKNSNTVNNNNSLYTNYINSTKNEQTFNDLSINTDPFDDIYYLFFKRFREIKCIIKNDKEVLYLTEFKNENYISTYKVVCALIVFLFAKFEVKLKLLFKVSDLDEDDLINATEIKRMIITTNHLFVEETDTLKMNSSILSQSLTNIKVENILKDLFEGQGDLNNILPNNGYCIDYKTFYKRVTNIKNYKYKLIPCFISFKDCLFSKKKEKIIKVRQKLKNDFINISSSFIAEQCQNINKSFNLKNYSKEKLNDIIQPIKYKEKNKKRVIKSNNNTFLKSLMKNCSTILDNKNDITSFNFYDSSTERFNNHHHLDRSFKNSKIAFQAHYSDIKNIEVEPGVIQILSNEDKKEEEKDNSNIFINDNNNKYNKSKFIRRNMFKYETRINLKKNINNNIKNKLLSKERLPKEKSFTSRIKKPFLPYNIKELSKGNKDIKKNYYNLYNNNYKTIEDIFKEIKIQEKLFNFDSIQFVNKEMVKESNNSENYMKKVKNTFIVRKEKPRKSSSFIGILYHKNGNLPQILSRKTKSNKNM